MLKSTSQGHLDKIFSEAYDWLKKSRKQHPPSSDIWNFRRCWNVQKDTIKKLFLSGSYRFDVQSKIRLSNGETIALWSSSDSLVLKVLTRLIQQLLQPVLSKDYYHLKGHGGLKGAVNGGLKHYSQYRFFCKTDVKDYYDSIDHYTVLMNLHYYIKDRKILYYVWQFLNRTVQWGGLYRDVTRGIARGSSLSPLIGAFYLMDLDWRIKRLDVKYFRFMDDILILAPTRWKLKMAIRVLNQTFNELKLEKHPDKTDMGRIEKGFDFLGYNFSIKGLGIAKKTIENFILRAIRLYEQEPGEGLDFSRLGLYVKRWESWVKSIIVMSHYHFHLDRGR